MDIERSRCFDSSNSTFSNQSKKTFMSRVIESFLEESFQLIYSIFDHQCIDSRLDSVPDG